MMCTTSRHTLRGALLGLFLLAGAPALAADHAHDDADCAACHGPDVRHRATRTAACRTCHGPEADTGWGSVAFHGDDGDCTACHAFHDPTVVALPGASTDVELAALGARAGGTLPVACTPCHDRGTAQLAWLSAAHRAAGAWYHSSVTEVLGQSISESCLRCHDADQQLPDVLDAAWDPPRPHVQASHPFGIPVRSTGQGGFGIRASIDPRLVLVDGKIECTTCHDIYRETDDMLVDLGSTSAFCQGCHERSSAPGLALAR